MKNISMLLRTFLIILYCDFIKKMKVFTIIMSFRINEHQKITCECIYNTFFII